MRIYYIYKLIYTKCISNIRNTFREHQKQTLHTKHTHICLFAYRVAVHSLCESATILKQKARKVMKQWLGMVSCCLITLVKMLSANEAGLSTRWNVGADDAITRHRTKSSDKPDRRRTTCRSRRGVSCSSLLTPSTIQMKLVTCLPVNVPWAVLHAYTMYQDDHNTFAPFLYLCVAVLNRQIITLSKHLTFS